MKKIGVLNKINKSGFAKGIAMLIILSITFEVAYPTCAWALTSGPSQPEVQGFEPIGTSDMVDLFTGDFTYNIPLLDADGYPINISYHSGISMDDEASWVGLGWNINAGTINRTVRGIPDDFNGDKITKYLNMKPNRTFGVSGGVGGEFFGFEALGFNAGLGFNYNNYRGMGVELSAGISLSSSLGSAGPLNANLGLTSSSENGLTIAPSISFSARIAGTDKSATTSLGMSVGTSFNSRAGLKKVSFSANVSSQSQSMGKENEKKHKTQTDNISSKEAGVTAGGASSTFSFGSATYTPSGGPNMNTFSITGNFKAGIELFGANGTANIGGYYNQQKLAQTTIVNPAYGYMNHEKGIGKQSALLDFNRENDGSFSENTPAMWLTQQTFDGYSVSGQGVGGSYRPVRSEVSYVYDPITSSTSTGFDIGVELGVGNLAHSGGDLTVSSTTSSSGLWQSQNNSLAHLKARSNSNNSTYENYYFKEANEKTVDADELYNTYGGKYAVRAELLDNGNYNKVSGTRFQASTGGFYNMPVNNFRSKREKRNQVIYPLTRKEVKTMGAGLEDLPPLSFANTQPDIDHHISEITTYSTDGSRYIYGIPAYNKFQQEITFAVGATPNDDDYPTVDCVNGLVNYSATDRGTGNQRGLDNYYSETHTPAYAHSYLLSAVLSPDYIDADQVKGPSDGDLGYYTKFYYQVIGNYKWRTPYTSTTMQASYNEGMQTDKNDDKANILYGEKELYYLDSIVTKNYIVIFHKSNREDGIEAGGLDGGIGTQKMLKLDKISLYSRWDYRIDPVNAVPLKEVHFVYDYSLCKGIPNNSGAAVLDADGNNVNYGGKLTLKQVFFTYQKSNKAKFSSYKFVYDSANPNYSYKSYDRWGNYKEISSGAACGAGSSVFVPAEFPYVEQSNQTVANSNVSAWHMTDIKLPSGGNIHVDYETDDYAYVQNKPAMQMFTMTGYEGETESSGSFKTNPEIFEPGRKIYFKLDNGNTDINKYFGDLDLVYFRFLTETNNGEYDYVSGYFKIKRDGSGNRLIGTETTTDGTFGYVIPQEVQLNDAGTRMVNPITKAAIQYSRLNLPRLIYNQPGISDNDSFDEQLLNALISVVSNFSQVIQGENEWVIDNHKCETAIRDKCFIRLYTPDGRKFGGGVRVSKIEMSDEWFTMTDENMTTSVYGQEYFYDSNGNGTGTSMGVAAYEPQLGGDENVWKKPLFTHEKNLLAPDNEHYLEEPFGESMFPAPTVGYSKVTVRNLTRDQVKRHATGRVEHEFFTAYDFPTIVEKTDVLPLQDKSDPFSITSLFYVDAKDYMTASQGFYVEVNDMHGKPKKQNVYAEGENTPITSVEYKYKSLPYLTSSKRLDNSVKVVMPDGTIANKNIGIVFDMVSDFREQKTELNSVATMVNLDGFVWPFPPVPIAVPIFLPSTTHEITQFRGVTTTKLVQRFGILEETIAKDLGSIVSTKNLAYDSETGEVLATQTATNFNDAIYTMTFPSHWYYEGMSQSYKNIGFQTSSLNFVGGVASYANANKFFNPGDEMITGGGQKVWVITTSNTSFTVVDKSGNPLSGSHTVKIIRSGKRNMAASPIANITMLADPTAGLSTNFYSQVLQASAIEFTDKWRTFCDCFDDPDSPLTYSTNPYILGTRGNWRMKTSFLHLSPRSQSLNNGNTNIRKDGIFTSFNPYYRLNAGKWQVDEKNWTYTSEVTEMSPFGQELENRDALGRFSAATFGYRQSMATAVAANARYRDIGFDNFEDYGFSKCADQHFKFHVTNEVVDNESHSGRRSIKISSGQSMIMKKALEICSPVGCTLLVNETGTTLGHSISISGGEQPYQVDWNVVSGTPLVQFTGYDFSSLSITGSSYIIEIIVLDGQGCKTTKQIIK